jgi:hypothetical protein
LIIMEEAYQEKQDDKEYPELEKTCYLDRKMVNI